MEPTEQAPPKKYIVPDNAGKCFCTHPYVQVYEKIGIEIGTSNPPPPTAYCLLCGTRGYMDKYQVQQLGRSINEYRFNADIRGDFDVRVVKLTTKEQLEEAQKRTIKCFMDSAPPSQ